MKPKIVKLMFDGVTKDCEVSIDSNGEYLCLATDGRFIKFPKDSDLADLVEKHNTANSAVPILTSNENPRDDATPPHIEKAVAIDLVTGTQYLLTTKREKYCHFFDRFNCKNYDIGLRLDWRHSDLNGDPTLDADFFPPGSNKPIKAMKKHRAHQTKKSTEPNSGKLSYEFEFQDLKLCLIIQTTNIREISGKARIISPKTET